MNDKWTEGRMNPHGKDWLKEYAQKDFTSKKTSIFRRILRNLKHRRRIL